MHFIDLHENQIYIRLAVTDNRDLKLLHFSALPLKEEDLVAEAIPEGFPFLSINLSGFDRPYERHGNKYIVTAPGYRMKYLSHSDERNEYGRLITFHTKDEETGVTADSFWQFYGGLPVIRTWHTVTNNGTETQTLEYVANFHYEGIEKEGSLSRDEKLKIRIPHNGWQRELNWKVYTFPELGMELVQEPSIQRSSNHLHISNTGNWSAKEYLPMAYLENTEVHTGIFWEIDHNGSWHWEIGDQNGHFYLALGRPQ